MTHGIGGICPWTYAQYFMYGSCYRSWNLSSKCLLSPVAWGKEKFMQSGFHMCSTMAKEPRLFFLLSPNCNIREMKAVHFSITFQQLTSHRCIHLTHSWNGRMLNGMPKCHRGRKLHSTVKARLALRHKLVHGVILLHDNATPQRHSDVQYLVQHWGWEVLAHPTFQISPHVITGCLHMWKIPSSRKTFESEDGINTAVTATLHWARMNTELQLIVYHVGGKSVWTVLVITLRRGRMCTHSGMLVVLLSCILLFQ